ncbi:MAG: MltA domain-containing protein [Gallionella sp.]
MSCIDHHPSLRLTILFLLFALASCSTKEAPTPSSITEEAPFAPFAVSKWEMLPDWQTQDLQPAWAAFSQSCTALKSKPDWQPVCDRANELGQPDNDALRNFFEEGFTPYQVFNPDGTTEGLITGYYEPKLYGSRITTERFRYPVYGVPDDLLTIELSELYPKLKGMRLRGRVEENRIVPYYDRGDIDSGSTPLKGSELFWVDNEIELFFLQIQGSGRIELPDGSLVKIGYANQNGHPYASIGRKLVNMGALTLEEASMQSIKQWGKDNPHLLPDLLAHNPSYVFFRELPTNLSAPLGALGVPLTGEYSMAVDRRTIPLGSPVFLSTTYPNTDKPLNRLMLAQDTGGAIRGAVRGDFFWGFGEQAGAQAGRMKQSGQMWVLFPKEAEPELFP